MIKAMEAEFDAISQGSASCRPRTLAKGFRRPGASGCSQHRRGGQPLAVECSHRCEPCCCHRHLWQPSGCRGRRCRRIPPCCSGTGAQFSNTLTPWWLEHLPPASRHAMVGQGGHLSRPAIPGPLRMMPATSTCADSFVKNSVRPSQIPTMQDGQAFLKRQRSLRWSHWHQQPTNLYYCRTGHGCPLLTSLTG